MNERTSGVLLRSGTEFFIIESPRKRRENPTISSEMLRLWFFLDIDRMKPNAINGTARIEMSALNPSHETSHAVTVVPILAPMMTLIAWARVSRPALTKLTTMTVVALDD